MYIIYILYMLCIREANFRNDSTCLLHLVMFSSWNYYAT